MKTLANILRKCANRIDPPVSPNHHRECRCRSCCHDKGLVWIGTVTTTRPSYKLNWRR